MPISKESGSAEQYAKECVRYSDTPGSVSDVLNLARAYLALGAERDALREALDRTLTAYYHAAPVSCAAICDDLDRSGALLGRIRDLALERPE